MARPAAATAPEQPRSQRPVLTALLALAHFVCPLLFFTDLTRNPYLTQIALLNILLLAALAALATGWARTGEWRLPRTAVDAPWLAWLAACALSFAVSYAGHAAFFRPAMAAEGSRTFQFLLVNALLPFYLALTVPAPSDDEPSGAAPWGLFCVLWGLGWLMFSRLRAPAASDAIFAHVWDPFGALLWAAGCAAVLWLARRGRLLDFWHLALSVGLLASGYAVLQYFSVDWVWPKVLNPYGGRSVSTFGNPNFMSSYIVVLLPMAAVMALRARGAGDRAFYSVCFWAFSAALLCSLTRSSWIGAAAALATLCLWPAFRRDVENKRGAFAALLVPALAMALLWPTSTVEGYTPSVWGRITEIANIWSRASEGDAARFGTISTGQVVYGPWHQRLLIWSVAWQMGLENPLTGNGWGLFELFYPFYQGPLLLSVEMFRVLRTHANNSHNEILEVFSQTGLLGLGVLLWFWSAFTAAFRRRGEAAGGWARWAAAAGVAGMLVDNLMNVSLHFAVPAFLFWWQAGAALAPAEGEPESERVWRPAVWRSYLGAALTAAAVVWGVLHWAGQWRREADYFSGFKRIRQGQVADAVKILEAAHKSFPREVNTNYELGNAYARASDYTKAVWAYDEALKSNAGYDEIYFNKASLLHGRLGRTDEALANYRVANAINPLSRDALTGLMNVYLKEPVRWADTAVPLLREARRLFPTDVNIPNNLGFFLVQKKDYAGAAEAFRDAVQVDPEHPVSRANLAHALGQTGKAAGDPTLEALARLDALDARVRKSDFGDQSLAMAKRCAADLPGSVRARLYYGNLLLIHNDLAGAEPELKAVLAREPGHISAHRNLAVLYERSGRPALAAGEYRAILQAAPGDKEALDALRRLSSQ